MRITRLVIAGSDDRAPLTVEFDPDLSVFDHGPSDTKRLRSSLALLLSGTTAFGRAFVEIDGVEIEATPEIAAHFGERLERRNEIVDAVHLARHTTPNNTAAAVALRAALELRRAIEPQLDLRTIDAALQAVTAEKQLLVSEARLAEAEAGQRRQEAAEALAKINHWSGMIKRAHQASEEARAKSRRSLSGPFSYRAYTKVRQEELDLLEAGNFVSYDDFLTYSAVSTRDYTDKLQAAELELLDAQKSAREISEGRSTWSHAQGLTVHEYVLRLARGVLRADHELTNDDLASVTNSIEVMLDLRYDEFGGSAEAFNDSIDEATTWLGRIESEHVRDHLERALIVHAEQLPVLGTVPLVLDGLFDGLSPAAARHVLGVLDAYVGRVQVVFLDRHEEISRWVAAHRTSSS